jgi:ATP-dependent Clp protease ATP-binding subunit ClpC
MSKSSLRVHIVVHEDGRRTGKLLRTWDGFFDKPAPAAYGITTQDVFDELEAKLEAQQIEAPGTLGRYLWEEDFRTQKVKVDVHPLSSVKKRPVIGKKEIPLMLTYASCPLKGGGYRVMLPRFGGWFIVEDLSLAPEVLRHFVSTLLLGENPKWIYDFRDVGEEYITEWWPSILQRMPDLAANKQADVDPHVELARVADDWVGRASKGKLAPVVGESAIFQRLVGALGPKRPSFLLVGPPGVGKSTLVRRLAFQMLAVEKKNDEWKPPRIYSTSKDRIIAGMTYLGMWQERCIKMARELSDDGDYLHIGSLTGFIESQHDGAAISDFFEAGLADGSIHIIAESTQEELERARRAKPQFIQRFQIIRVEEPTPLDATTLALAYAKKKHIEIHPSAMKRLVRHLTALERGVAFPGKALRFVDWMALENKDAPKKLWPRDASEAYSRYSGVPFTLLSDDVAAGADQLADLLKARVIGQDAACSACGRLLARFKANLNDPERPCGVLLFVGPTGVGKTELAKQLARTTFGGEARMIRFDMSEYMLPGSASRLTSGRAGTASLASKVRDQPLSLVLLDEIEKAHSEVFDLLLGILGEGRLTDDSGRFVDFRTTMIVMTSNLGVTETRAAGFGEASGGDYLRKVRAHFRPELYNRIDYVLAFRALAQEDVARIVDLELDAVAQRAGLIRRSVKIAASPAARTRLAERGYHPTRGARPLRRLIEDVVMTPIAAKIAADPSFRDRTVQVVADHDDEAAPSSFAVRV